MGVHLADELLWLTCMSLVAWRRPRVASGLKESRDAGRWAQHGLDMHADHGSHTHGRGAKNRAPSARFTCIAMQVLSTEAHEHCFSS